MGMWDETLVGGGSGAATGALIGSAVPGIGTGIGAAVGGGIGLLSGYFGSKGRQKAADAQRRAMEQAMARLEAFGQQQYANRMADLDKTMAFYQPAQAELDFMYGGQLPSTGGGPMSYVGPSGGGTYGVPSDWAGSAGAARGRTPVSGTGGSVPQPGPIRPPALPDWMTRGGGRRY